MYVSAYDYRRFLLRTDPTSPTTTALSTAAEPACPLDLAGLNAGEYAATRPVIVRILAEVAPDQDALHAMVAVLDTFTAYAERRGVRTWPDTTTALVTSFVRCTEVDLADDARLLRKNTVHAAYLALVDADLQDDLSPAEGVTLVDPSARSAPSVQQAGADEEGKTRRKYSDRTHVRPATHDEITLIRLATRFAGTTRAQHLPAAAVAICSSTATTSEAPQVLWEHLRTIDGDEMVQLAGRVDENNGEEKAIARRTVPLDMWCVGALEAWRTERSEVRPVDPTLSVLYSGAQSLVSNSAQVSTDKQIAKVLGIADLSDLDGLTAGSLRLWAATRHITDLYTLDAGAAAAGIEPLTLHRHVTQQGDRGLRRSS